MRNHEFKVKPIVLNSMLIRWRFQCIYCGEEYFSDGVACSIVLSTDDKCSAVEVTEEELGVTAWYKREGQKENEQGGS